MTEARVAWAGDLDPRRVSVRTSESAYDVCVGAGLLARLGEGVAQAAGRGSGRVLLAWDDGLPFSTVERARASLRAAGLDVAERSVHPTEAGKSLGTMQGVLVAAAEARLERSDTIVALGGGIVGDVAGFAAATYRRGVDVVQCPTTLLAMVDASVGGKTGVNLEVPGVGGKTRLLKNLVGVFHQPRLVVADTDTLASLDVRDYAAGLAECVKHGMIAADWDDADLLDWTGDNAAGVVARDPDLVRELIIRNIAVKARVVAADERETAEPGRPGRMLLNLGHTFGHALETIPTAAPEGGRSPLRHGEAVALGLVCAGEAAESLGHVGAGLADEVRGLLRDVGLPTGVTGLPPTPDIVEAMRHDKKAGAGRLRVVLPVGPGRCRVFEDPPADALARSIDAIRLP